MIALVVDSSVAIKWLVSEEGSDHALALRGTAMAAPQLLIAECTNTLWKKVQRGELTRDAASIAGRLLAKIDLTLLPMEALATPALELALRLKHPSYDCFFVAAADSLGAHFVTADRRLWQTLHDASHPRILTLAEAAARFGSPGQPRVDRRTPAP